MAYIKLDSCLLTCRNKYLFPATASDIVAHSPCDGCKMASHNAAKCVQYCTYCTHGWRQEWPPPGLGLSVRFSQEPFLLVKLYEDVIMLIFLKILSCLQTGKEILRFLDSLSGMWLFLSKRQLLREDDLSYCLTRLLSTYFFWTQVTTCLIYPDLQYLIFFSLMNV